MMKRSIGSLLALLTPFVLTFCGNNEANVVTPIANGVVDILDACDPLTFTAALGAGPCTGLGTISPTITFREFVDELAANRSVGAWRFAPTSVAITPGGTITATNLGGETHTFTEVAQFGGGTVPLLNQASGNPTETPECAAITDADLIAPEASFTTAHLIGTGTHLFQCCIHPWMRETVTVTSP
jgi:plastocyanin